MSPRDLVYVGPMLDMARKAAGRELKKRAAGRNHSAEQEHREILEQALLRPRRRSLAEVLAAMQDVGKDTDFERRQVDRRT
jgi:plasmid stability protein